MTFGHLGFLLLAVGVALFVARESGRIGAMPKFFETHAVATSLMIAGAVGMVGAALKE